MTDNLSYYKLPQDAIEKAIKTNNDILNTGEGSFFPDAPVTSDSFKNTLYALNTALETRFRNLLFNGEAGRIVHTLNNYAMRKRAKDDTINTLNFPFLNYKEKDIKPITTRLWRNHMANIDGIYVEELNRKLRLLPITIEYEATFWVQRDDDMQYAFQKLAYDHLPETKQPYYIEINGQDLKMFSYIMYSLQYEPKYTEEDWLKRNNIHTIGMDFKVETFYILDNLNICLPNSVILSFIANNYTTDETADTITKEMIINHYNETATESA